MNGGGGGGYYSRQHSSKQQQSILGTPNQAYRLNNTNKSVFNPNAVPNASSNPLKDSYYGPSTTTAAATAAAMGVFNHNSVTSMRNKSAILSHLNLNTKAREELEKRKLKAKLEKEKEGKRTMNKL